VVRNNAPPGVTEIELEDRDATLWWIIRNQFGRRDLTPYQRAELALKLEPVIERKAKENQGTRTDILENSPKSIQPVNTPLELSKLAGVSDNTMAKAKAIAEKAPEEVKEKVRSGDISIHKAYSDIKQVEKREHKAAIAEQISREQQPNPLPDHDRGGNRGATSRQAVS